jgi:hypothetical protein
MALKMRYCFNCGCELGMIEDRNYVRTDTCGDAACEREVRDMYEREREERHREVDRDYGWF